MKLSVNKTESFYFYVMNDKLKIKIKIDIVGPINWTRDILIDYNNLQNPSIYGYLPKPFDCTLNQIQSATSNLEYLFEQMKNCEFKLIE